jgi:VanZ family protein
LRSKPPGGLLSSHNLALCAWIGLIFFSSTDTAARWAHAIYAVGFAGPGIDGPVSMFVLQKGYHVFLFSVLGWLVAAANWSRLDPMPRAVLWCFLVGLLSEALQFAFEGRGPSVADVLLNGASGSAAGWIWARWCTARGKAVAPVAES